MYRLEREQYLQSPYVPIWATLGFQAGYINAFGFLACGRFVSHVTGFGTQIGLAVASSEFLFALELIGFPLSFILGAFSSSFLTSVRLELNLKPQYHLITLLLPLILIALMGAGMYGAFGPFGEQLILPRDFALLFLLSFVCGMQNGCFATLTKGQVRTTHLTGISTDLGTDLARLMFGNLSFHEYRLTRATNIVRVATFLAFAVGSIMSVIISQHLGYGALFAPCVTSMAVYFGLSRIQADLDGPRDALSSDSETCLSEKSSGLVRN